MLISTLRECIRRVVDDVKLAIVARRVRRPVGDGRFVAVARAQGAGLAVTEPRRRADL